ncbi:MAG: hypothetical protein C7B45_15790 [Sulfobacillus acidophilus]|uniref:Uncharacterized protein n=1 Tax=Sulfobacillus acidophilus TaxID=53633 RepID=A0A2T2WDC0_9FIRM|nr:MAG: hypothetical protein C7B45_15790 [Sulfobacillus acidophilus]
MSRRRQVVWICAAALALIMVAAGIVTKQVQRTRRQAITSEVRSDIAVNLIGLDAPRIPVKVNGHRRYVTNEGSLGAQTVLWQWTLLLLNEQDARPPVDVHQFVTVMTAVGHAPDQTPVPREFLHQVPRSRRPTVVALAQVQYPQFPWGVAHITVIVSQRLRLYPSPGHPLLTFLPGSY